VTIKKNNRVKKIFFILLLHACCMNVSIAQKSNLINIHYSLTKEVEAGKKYNLPVNNPYAFFRKHRHN
jgi:hypothetical protein